LTKLCTQETYKNLDIYPSHLLSLQHVQDQRPQNRWLPARTGQDQGRVGHSSHTYKVKISYLEIHSFGSLTYDFKKQTTGITV
jgi:hypothetical protein